VFQELCKLHHRPSPRPGLAGFPAQTTFLPRFAVCFGGPVPFSVPEDSVAVVALSQRIRFPLSRSWFARIHGPPFRFVSSILFLFCPFGLCYIIGPMALFAAPYSCFFIARTVNSNCAATGTHVPLSLPLSKARLSLWPRILLFYWSLLATSTWHLLV